MKPKQIFKLKMNQTIQQRIDEYYFLVFLYIIVKGKITELRILFVNSHKRL